MVEIISMGILASLPRLVANHREHGEHGACEFAADDTTHYSSNERVRERIAQLDDGDGPDIGGGGFLLVTR